MPPAAPLRTPVRACLSPQWLCTAVIVLAVLAVYSGGWHNGFLANWDDPEYVTANPFLQAFTLENLRAIFTSRILNFYSPVHVLSYWFDMALWGLNPRGFLFTNALLHALNGVLFFRILIRLGVSNAGALFAALLFAVHPVQVESVAWISQRKSVLSLAFLLLSSWQYLSFTEGGRGRWRHYALALGFFLLALLSKLVVVILPAILLGYDLLLRARKAAWWPVLMEKLPFAFLGLLVVWHAVADEKNTAPALVGGSQFNETMTMLTVYQHYLVNLLWPLRLSAEYQVDVKHAPDAEVFTALLLLGLTLASAWAVGSGRRRAALFCLAVVFIGLLPVAQIIPFVHLMYDRYLYIPLLGFAALAALLLGRAIEKFRLPLQPVRVGAVVILLLLAGVAWQRTGVWGSSLALWRDATEKQPGAAKAWEGLGHSYQLLGDQQAAIVSYQRALTLAEDSEIRYKTGTAYLDAGQPGTAVQHLLRAAEIDPTDDRALYNLGYAYLLTGEFSKAVGTMEQAVRLDPQGLDLLVYLGIGYYCLGELPSARLVYEQVRSSSDRRSDFPVLATGVLALIALRQGDAAASGRLWREAVAGGLSEVELYLNWARLEALARHRGETLEFAARARSLGGGGFPELLDDPAFATLRGDAEFVRLVKP